MCVCVAPQNCVYFWGLCTTPRADAPLVVIPREHSSGAFLLLSGGPFDVGWSQQVSNFVLSFTQGKLLVLWFSQACKLELPSRVGSGLCSHRSDVMSGGCGSFPWGWALYMLMVLLV